MKRYTVLFSRDAQDDLEKIVSYIAVTLENPHSANKTMKKINNKCKSLTVFPKVGMVKFVINAEEYRSVHVDNYIIIYTVDAMEKIVRIRGIWYGRQNLSQRIKGLGG